MRCVWFGFFFSMVETLEEKGGGGGREKRRKRVREVKWGGFYFIL